jgi:hypothetical protein
LNNKGKPRKIERSTRSLTRSSRESVEWVSKVKETSHSQVSNSLRDKECQANTEDNNTNSNSKVKEVAIWEEEVATEEAEAACPEVECNLCQPVVSLRDKECLSQDRCNSKWDHLTLNSSQEFLKFN